MVIFHDSLQEWKMNMSKIPLFVRIFFISKKNSLSGLSQDQDIFVCLHMSSNKM